LSDRIAKKFDQTKAQGRVAKRIVIAQIPEAREKNEVGRKIAQGVQERLIPKYTDIAGIILTSRVWTHQGRFRYLAYLLKGKDRDDIMDEVYEKIGNIDFAFDLLHDWS
jgi:hypothetical protein